MCAQTESAGGAGVAYSLARYGAGSGTGTDQNYLDKLSLISSPPLADIRAGCQVDDYPDLPVTVCPSGQLGCNSHNSPSSWSAGGTVHGRPVVGTRVDGDARLCGKRYNLDHG